MTVSLNKKDLFVPGMNDSEAYRIPTLITTDKGTLIAANDARILNQRDNPNKINITIRRSFDHGETWTEIHTVAQYPGNDMDSPAVIDSSLLQDKETGTIWMLFCHTPGGIGLWNSETGVGFNSENQRVLYDNQRNVYYLKDNLEVIKASGDSTDYTVDSKGYLYKNNEKLGHIYQKFDPHNSEALVENPTSFLQAIKSDDDGKTWSSPIELNVQVKEEWMRFIGTGPGRGIQLKNSSHKGRLIFPIYFSNEARIMSSTVIYSDDNGKTWKRSASPNDNRDLSVTYESAENLGLKVRQFELTECQAVELSDGTIHLYMRNHYGNGRVARAISHDGGETWSDFEFIDDLLNPICQFSVITYPSNDEDWILFLGPRSQSERENGVLLLSKDGGKTFPYQKTIEEGSFVYSCLTLTEDGDIGILYETEQDSEGLIKSVFTKVSVNELEE